MRQRVVANDPLLPLRLKQDCGKGGVLLETKLRICFARRGIEVIYIQGDTMSECFADLHNRGC